MNLKKFENKKAAPVLERDERQTKESKIIIPILRTVVNGVAAGLIGISVAMLVLLGAVSFAAIFVPAVGLAFLGDRL